MILSGAKQAKQNYFLVNVISKSHTLLLSPKATPMLYLLLTVPTNLEGVTNL